MSAPNGAQASQAVDQRVISFDAAAAAADNESLLWTAGVYCLLACPLACCLAGLFSLVFEPNSSGDIWRAG